MGTEVVDFCPGPPVSYLGVCFLPWHPPAPGLHHIPKGLSSGARATEETGTCKEPTIEPVLPHQDPCQTVQVFWLLPGPGRGTCLSEAVF